MSDKPSILLVNPPIYDFAAFDFWLKPLGMLTVAGAIANQTDSFDLAQDRFQIFDFLDRNHEFYKDKPQYKSDKWGRGKFFSVKIQKPDVLKEVPRFYHRFGLPAEIFTEFLETHKPCDFVFIQTVMTYWYLGYREVIEAIRKYWPKTKIILGGPYSMICPDHTKNLGADFVLTGNELNKLWDFLNIKPDGSFLPPWDIYKRIETAAMKITNGCPFKCTYCVVPMLCDSFSARPIGQAIEELNFLVSRGVKNIAFYDDALLYKSDEVLKPFLKYVIENKIDISFHTPNALNARFIDEEIAGLMVKAGFKSFYLGFESRAGEFQRQTGSKIFDNEFADAVKTLIAAGANKNSIIAYLVFGHPKFEIQEVEKSMEFVSNLGIRIMLASFSPIPGTPDGRLCEKYVDMNEPLMHNKTAFPIILFGSEKVNKIKDMCRKLNEQKSKS
ncbi:MAG: radical SAM protein [Sedimentisphaerales bacterium]